MTWFELSFQIPSCILGFECFGFQMKSKSNYFLYIQTCHYINNQHQQPLLPMYSPCSGDITNPHHHFYPSLLKPPSPIATQHIYAYTKSYIHYTKSKPCLVSWSSLSKLMDNSRETKTEYSVRGFRFFIWSSMFYLRVCF